MGKTFLLAQYEGTYYEIGYTHGLQYKDLIREAIDSYLRYLEYAARETSGIDLPREKCLSFCSKLIPFAREYSPSIFEEVKGIADGSTVDFEEVFFINCFLDISDLLVPRLFRTLLLGCTSFAVSGKASSNGEVFVGQTYDLPPVFQKFSLLLRIKPKNDPEILLFTIAGVVGCAGQNSSGLSLVINNLVSSDCHPGVPYPFVLRKALQQERIGDSIACIISPQRASGLNYLLGDKSGEIFDIETTATVYDVIYGFHGYIGHSNHYLSEKLKSYQEPRLVDGNSILRFSRINRLLNSRCGEITLQDLKEFSRDHVNFPFSICGHADQSVPMGRKTIASIIFLPAELKSWFSFGNPCENEYIEYTL